MGRENRGYIVLDLGVCAVTGSVCFLVRNSGGALCNNPDICCLFVQITFYEWTSLGTLIAYQFHCEESREKGRKGGRT